MSLDLIRKKHKLSLIILHGSQVTGRIHKGSDFDVAVVRSKNSKFDLLELIEDLGIYFSTEKIDLVDITHADPLLLFSVVSKGKLLSGNVSDFKNLEMLAFLKYSDYMPYLKIESDFINKRINQNNYAKS